MPDSQQTPHSQLSHMEERAKAIGVLLRKARLNAGLDIETCARALEEPAERIEAYEAGRVHLTLPHMEIFSRLFGIPVTYYWSESPAPDNGAGRWPAPLVMTVRRRMIGVLLRQARLAAGKSLNECAALLDVNPETIAAYEYGREDIIFPTLERLAEFLHVPMAYFADEELLSNLERERQALELLKQLPPDIREFVLKPANVLYVRLAMLLSGLSTETLRQLGEGLLDITL